MSFIDILTFVMYVAVVVVSIMLICLVLVQPSKSGGLGATFGGIGQNVFGAHAGSHLTKLTVVMTSIFFVLALVLAVMVSRRTPERDLDLELQRNQPALVEQPTTEINEIATEISSEIPDNTATRSNE